MHEVFILPSVSFVGVFKIILPEGYGVNTPFWRTKSISILEATPDFRGKLAFLQS